MTPKTPTHNPTHSPQLNGLRFDSDRVNDLILRRNHLVEVSDEETIAQMEREEEARRLEEACGLFLALESVYEREKVVWRLFVGSQPTVEQNKLYGTFREMLVQGSRLKANA